MFGKCSYGYGFLTNTHTHTHDDEVHTFSPQNALNFYLQQ